MSSGSVFRVPLKTKWCNSITGNTAAIVPSAPIRTAISPSIARLANSLPITVQRCRRTSLSNRHPRIGPSMPNCCTVPGPGTAHFVAGKAIAGGNAKRRHGILQRVGVGQIEGKAWIRKACPGLARSIVVPLAIRQCLDFARHDVTDGGLRPSLTRPAVAWPNTILTLGGRW